MKNWVVLGLCLSVLWSATPVFGEQQFITSDELTVEDVKKTVVNHVKTLDKDGALKEIYGIYRNEGNKSNLEVFWSAVIDGKAEQSSTTLLRFTSGKWFNADISEVLTK